MCQFGRPYSSYWLCQRRPIPKMGFLLETNGGSEGPPLFALFIASAVLIIKSEPTPGFGFPLPYYSLPFPPVAYNHIFNPVIHLYSFFDSNLADEIC